MDFIDSLPLAVRRLAEAIAQAGGRPVIVGGAVRDHWLGLVPKDFDIEAYGLPIGRLQQAMERVAKVHAVGKCFGVLKAKMGGTEVDVSLPRREKKVGQGHRGFAVDYDPFMSFAEAGSRRDFTINAMGVDFIDGKLLDPWQGRRDLDHHLIRHVSDAFDEDPLRVLRACQFAARFNFSIAKETLDKCLSLQQELATLSKERIWEEMKKLLLKSARPSLGMAAMDQTGALILLPELAALQGAGHDVGCHPEGDVWVHNQMVLDRCAALCREEGLEDKEALVLLLAALCHDLGKPATARLVDGLWRNPGHEQAGEQPTRSLLAQIDCPGAMVESIVALVREHGQVRQLWKLDQIAPVPDGTIRRLALRTSIQSLCRLALADFRGYASPQSQGPCHAVEWLKRRAQALGVWERGPQPILQGRNLQALGLRPGPEMGVMLRSAFDAQLDGEFGDLPGALAWAHGHLHAHTASALS